ncbi:hypothetical protein [Fodinicurvata fenggangensis]|uniref:hypothetical protein n=1 Tax=Fodinicurvata fenggangensis TaxID=1121830 RepID=UPI00047DFAF3|nr:hypothetical protein [Fodinicurvata fenggangensis]
MVDWLKEYSDVLNVLANITMILVWMIYLHLLLISYRRQRRPKLLINRGGSQDVKAHCLISNMSAESVYIQSLIVTLKNEEKEWTAAVTDIDDLQAEDATNPQDTTHQGPLAPGAFMDAGCFSNLIERAARKAGLSEQDLKETISELELMVVAAYGADDMSIAAKRRFHLKGNDELTPQTVSSQQISSRRARRKVDRFLAEHL